MDELISALIEVRKNARGDTPVVTEESEWMVLQAVNAVQAGFGCSAVSDPGTEEFRANPGQSWYLAEYGKHSVRPVVLLGVEP